MSTLSEVLGNLSQDRQKKPVMFPACSKAEIKYASYYSACAIKRIAVATREMLVTSANGSTVSADVVFKPGVGEPTGLIVRSRELPSLEGTILHTNFSTPCRPLFAYAIYPRESKPDTETSQLGTRLDYLDIAYPDFSHYYVDTLSSLLSTCGVSTGDEFYSNIMVFSQWLNKSLWRGEKQNWATK